jgi:hypothetical protein
MTGMAAALSCPSMGIPRTAIPSVLGASGPIWTMQQRSSEHNLTSAMSKRRPPSSTAEDRNAGSFHSTICAVDAAAVLRGG